MDNTATKQGAQAIGNGGSTFSDGTLKRIDKWMEVMGNH